MLTPNSLRLNFFVVPIADCPLPVFVRQLAGNETLRQGERLWGHRGNTPDSTQAVLVTQSALLSDYMEEMVPGHQLPPSIVKGLLHSGLEETLRRGQNIVEAGHLALACFRPEETVREGAPPFVIIRRGVEFRVDHFSADGQRTYGFFVSTKVRVQFRNSPAEDACLAEAALGERIIFGTGDGVQSGKVLSVHGHHGLVDILDDKGERRVGTLGDMRVPASQGVLTRYSKLVGRPELATEVRRAAQMASYRLGRNGQRNRRWLREQMAQVRTWLIAVSRYDRLPLRWPNSSQDLFLCTLPLEILEHRAT